MSSADKLCKEFGLRSGLIENVGSDLDYDRLSSDLTVISVSVFMPLTLIFAILFIPLTIIFAMLFLYLLLYYFAFLFIPLAILFALQIVHLTVNFAIFFIPLTRIFATLYQKRIYTVILDIFHWYLLTPAWPLGQKKSLRLSGSTYNAIIG